MFLNIYLICLINFLTTLNLTKCSLEEEKLIKTLFKSYNKLIRPVKNSSEYVTITMDLVLLQLINVYEKEQIMKTNVWINLKWTDFQLNWTQNQFSVGSIRVPYDKVWTPDIVLFNNADGNYEASYKPNVLVYADTKDDGESTNILWIPPAIYKSSCTIDVKYFPFDEQKCEMRFGSWTFDAQQVRLRQEKPMVNLEDYLPSGTWDVIEAPGEEADFAETNRMELVYKFKIRRKTLFYTVNLIIPTVLISFLSIFVFYLPTDEGEKMTLCISILLALVVFLLLVSKILPPTSMVIPLISKYLIFTFIMNIITILNTVIIINWNYRTPRTHKMPKWVRLVFIDFFPKILFMKRPDADKSDNDNESLDLNNNNNANPNTNVEKEFKRKRNLDEDSFELNNNLNSPGGNNFNLALLNTSNPNSINQETNLDYGANNNESRSSTLHRHGNHDDGFVNMYPSKECSSAIQLQPPGPTYSHHPHSHHHSHRTHHSHNHPHSQRPKQQQHKNLDKIAVGLNSSKRSQLPNNSSFNNHHNNKSLNKKKYLNENFESDDDPITQNRNRLLTLSATDSILSAQYKQTNLHSTNNNPNAQQQQQQQYYQDLSYATNKASSSSRSNLTKRSSTRMRRQQYAQKHSKSLEYSGTTGEEGGGQTSDDDNRPIEFSPEIMEAADKVTYITNHIKNENYYEEMRDDWKYVALVIDRLQLIIFFAVTVVGTALILFNAPHIFQFVDQQEILNKLIKANKFNAAKPTLPNSTST